MHAVDISSLAVEVGRRGVYSRVASQLTNTDMFDRMTEVEFDKLFDIDRDSLTVKSWIKEGIEWHIGDVRKPEILDTLGPQDIVVANNFLCHMDNSIAERCLRNVARLVSQNGHLFISGMDLDVRTKVAEDLGWAPLHELVEEIHDAETVNGKCSGRAIMQPWSLATKRNATGRSATQQHFNWFQPLRSRRVLRSQRGQQVPIQECRRLE